MHLRLTAHLYAKCTPHALSRYVAAFMLAKLGGNASPGVADIKAILEAAGVSVDDASLATVRPPSPRPATEQFTWTAA